MQTPVDPEVQEVTLRFATFSISIRVSVTPNPIDTTVLPPETSVSLIPGGPDFHDPHHISRDLESLALAASTPTDLGALPLDFLAAYTDRLRGSGNAGLSSQERAGRAFRAGVAARRRLDGELCDAASTPIGLRNTIYVILQAPGLPRGGWTSSYNTFIRNCGGSASSDFSSSTVCHSFAARAEADVYLIGARRQWPPLI